MDKQLAIMMCLAAGVGTFACSGDSDDATPASSAVVSPTDKPESVRAASNDFPFRPAEPWDGVPYVVFAPDDLTTHLAPSVPLRLSIPNRNQAVDTKLLSELAASAKLRTWPDLKPISVEVVVRNAEPPAAHYNPRAFIELKPKTPLVDGWYVVSATAPKGLRWAKHSFSIPLGTNANERGARVRIGEEVVLRSVRFCQKAKQASALFVDLSSNVLGQSGANSFVGGSSCAHEATGSAPDGVQHIAFRCSAPSLPSAVTLDLGSVKTKKGVLLSGTNGGLVQVNKTDFSKWGESCFIARF